MLEVVFDTFKSPVLLAGFAAYLVYYKRYYGQIPKFYAKHDGAFSGFLQRHLKCMKESYWPLYILPSGPTQTILATLLPYVYKKVNFIKEVLVNCDGGQFYLAWADESGDESTEKVLLISPGLTSHTQTNYIQALVTEMSEQGYKCALIVNRGLELPLSTPKTYCATHTMDLKRSVKEIKQRCPNAKLLCCGVSLGGVILARYLSETGSESKIDAAFIFCSPLNCVATAASLEKWHNWILYGYYITYAMKRYYKKSHQIFTGVVDHDAVMSANGVRAFDSHFTARTFGYESVDHYYESARITEKKLLSFRTPTLYLLSDDDAFVPTDSIPYEGFKNSDYAAMMLTSGGGHVGYLQGANPLDSPYYTTVLSQYFRAVCEHSEEIADLGYCCRSD